MKDIFKMVGNAAAHSVWSVSDGELLIPILGSLDKNNETLYQRIAFDDSEEAMKYAQDKLLKNEKGWKGAVFSADGFVTLETGKTDALILNVRIYEEAIRKCTIIVPYRHAKSDGGFAIHRPKIVQVENIDANDIDMIMNAFFDGLESHEQGYKIWEKHYQDQAGQVSGDADISPDAWEILLRAPFLMFFAVAAADGKIDSKESKKLVKLIENAEKYKNQLFQRLLAETVLQASVMLQEIASGSINFIEELTKLSMVVDKELSASESTAFKKTLMEFGKDIAESSGGFLGFGSKVSKEEKKILAAIALIMNTDF